MTETTRPFSFLLVFPFFLFPGVCLSQMPPAPVVVSRVVEKEVKKPVNLVGSAYPARKSVISSEVEGIVRNLGAEEGEYVKKGEMLIEIKNEKLALALEELRNETKEASSEYRFSEREFRRIQKLHDKGIVSRGELDRITSRRDSSQAALLRLQSGVRKAEYDLGASEIRAPFNGYVTGHHTEVGQWIDVGEPVVSLVDIDTIEVMAGLPERYLGDVKPGDDVEVVVDSLGERVFAGKIFSIVPDADPKSRAFPVKVVLSNSDHLIKSSVSSVVRIRIGESEKMKLVPKDSMVSSPMGTVVFVVREGAAHPVPVKLVGWYGGDAHVEGPLSAGEDVVTRGNERLRPMQKVRIVGNTGP